MTATRIALDVMGGDDAPEATLRGALRACGPDGPLAADRVLLVGDRDRIASGLAELGGDPGFAVRHASQVIAMDESANALRTKKDSSIGGCVASVKSGEAGAIVAMGNTTAAVGASTLVLGTLQGVKRPAIAVTIELTGSPLTLLDMGANAAPKPEHLLQSAHMGAIHARVALGQENPRVGLLNVGEEPSKGTDLAKEAHALIAQAGLNFVGNVEGGDFFRDAVDVVVTDGFTGNVVLKVMEGLGGFLFARLRRELAAHDAAWGNEALARLAKQTDYSQYGGALLLGVDGVVLIGHGRSDETAVANALVAAARELDAGVNRRIVEGLAAAARA